MCKLALKEDKTIPVAFHNGRGYDFHLFVRSLGRVDGHISTIAKNSEQYISVDKSVYVSESTVVDDEGKSKTKKNTWKIRFIDSYGFLQASLENLVENFPKEKFKMLGEAFEGGKFDLVLRKGVFRYEWFDDIRKLNETEFPPIEAFYSSLTEEGISAGDYEHGLKVWEKMGFKTMREYHDMYILSGGRAPTRRHHGVPAGPVDEHPRVGYSTLLHTSWLLLARRVKIHGTGTEAYFQSGDVRLHPEDQVRWDFDSHSPVRESQQSLHGTD